jgi:hypothetical protein
MTGTALLYFVLNVARYVPIFAFLPVRESASKSILKVYTKGNNRMMFKASVASPLYSVGTTKKKVEWAMASRMNMKIEITITPVQLPFKRFKAAFLSSKFCFIIYIFVNKLAKLQKK